MNALLCLQEYVTRLFQVVDEGDTQVLKELLECKRYVLKTDLNRVV